ncbi:hypothetical protein [Desulfosporosinus sp. Sb-LF]|uniref:hypothetical protein n=1 Tax=Desulfosporosinus sp. Sb-LF TaxID=2560027 RepID=UPI00107F76D3|nr:hypothetical protein [Desulfosporosinus sp. Sb-LF]TGE32855.1 hypothetical protein E4K68_08375 [Desulfosporosinus sp. Sb-LF]
MMRILFLMFVVKLVPITVAVSTFEVIWFAKLPFSEHPVIYECRPTLRLGGIIYTEGFKNCTKLWSQL